MLLGIESAQTDVQQKLMWRTDGQLQWGFKKGPVNSNLEVMISKKKKRGGSLRFCSQTHSQYISERLLLMGLVFLAPPRCFFAK